ncbi:MAG: putative diguanylate cyclase [Candidatus Methanofastidiosum methylothiophilum]|uniref:Putative diguanylate cyclase n=1 Tax=Candidatus Methanofastidiosum methylothiophilum TaxID=1705564 RepID=A0A150IKL5_9EURY|nr:MAG: putative diguanylate cyclase [Candidatus Methanofastidiosum methylthiophilus]KYC47284.1 MAG: putative diguanylate cyclase [Candidatus Methanofastidiosum methylthiophilus]KYC49759.1 MAG: putative diguanylate cyclase [Candidatus Methanofastidiosum methylthiophilus]
MSKEELIQELIVQRSRITDLQKMKERLEELEGEKDVLLDNLKERVKELNCLYDISKANELPDIPLEELFQKIVEKIPLGWKYPEIACARIKLDGQEFRTINFKETKWKLDAPINYYNKNIGKLEVYYLEEKPELEEGPFLNAERKLILAIVEKLGHIIERKYSEQALKENEEKFRTLFNNASDAIFIHELDGNFIETNQIASDLLGYEKSELLNMAPSDIHPPEYLEMLNEMFEELKKRSYYCFETEVVTKDYRLISVEICSKIIKLKKKTVVISIVRDITERKLTEEKMKRQLMKFDLEAGKIYLVKEAKSLFSIEAFNDLVKVGYSGYILTRSLESEYAGQIEGKYNYLWISEKDKSSLSPDFTEIEKFLEDIPRKSFVLIDRVDYLLSKNGFNKFLSFVHHLREISYLRGITVIISADPEIFSAVEMKLIEKETADILPIEKEKLPDNMLEILRFVYSKNSIGVKPTFSDIGREINITRPTIGKRMSFLTMSNYIIVSIKGRNKVVELTNRGRELFSA